MLKGDSKINVYLFLTRYYAFKYFKIHFNMILGCTRIHSQKHQFSSHLEGFGWLTFSFITILLMPDQKKIIHNLVPHVLASVTIPMMFVAIMLKCVG